MKFAAILFTAFLFLNPSAQAQDPIRFACEVEALSASSWDTGDVREKLLFTGSSSIRMWDNIQKYFPEYQVMNTGFGGSQFTDLIYYADELILQHNPDRIFIYEGDNDIAEGKSPADVLEDAEELIRIIRKHDPDIPVYLISPKPSAARWELREIYEEANRTLSKLAEMQPGVIFIDVWNPMLNAEGGLDGDLFIEDGLHMTTKGYDIWGEVIRAALNPVQGR